MREIARQIFATLNYAETENLYVILNDGNFKAKFPADSKETAELIFTAWCKGGYREKYAIEQGRPEFKRCRYVTFYIDNEPTSDSNGAMYDIVEGKWVN